MTPTLIYCYDAYCGWCYGFSPVIEKISATFADRLNFEVLSGGMILPETPVPIGATAGYIREAYKNVEQRTGVKFGEDFLWHIFHPEESDWYPNSEKPAIALCIFKEYRPDLQVSFAGDIQRALNLEGRDLTDDEAYRHLVEKYELPVEGFYKKLGEEEYRQKALSEFALVKRLQVNGFPTVLVQADETRFYLASRGYTDYQSVSVILEKILYSIATASS